MPAAPSLTWFVELAEAPLAALLQRPEVLPFLRRQRATISLGLVDLGAGRARCIRELEAAGVPVTGWLLLDVGDGYWLNADNVAASRARWRETRAWAEREGLTLPWIGLDVEFPRGESEGAIRSRQRAFFSMLRRRRPAARVHEAEAAYVELVDEIRGSGRRVEAYHFPYLLDERDAGTTLLRRSLGLVDVPVDREVYMLYASYLGRGGARAYFDDAPAIALGVTGGGVNVDNPEAVRRRLPFERLAEDLRAALAHTPEVYVFSLEGCVERGWLGRLEALDWSEPAPALPAREARAGRRSRRRLGRLLRAEPLFDRWLPARPAR